MIKSTSISILRLRPLPWLGELWHPSQHSSMIGVLSTAEDRDENFEQNIEDCEEVNEKPQTMMTPGEIIGLAIAA
jgi:hypothetical protein